MAFQSEFTSFLRTYLASKVKESISSDVIDAWRPTTPYKTGDVVKNNGMGYVAITDGTSGSNGPSTNHGAVADGTLKWVPVSQLPITNVNPLYMLLLSESPADMGIQEIRTKAIAGVRVSNQNSYYAIRKNFWESKVYEVYQYEKTIDINCDFSSFYCISSNMNVYLCLGNNKGAESTVEPNQNNPEAFTLEDGYSWRYIGTLSQENVSTKDYIALDYPIKTLAQAHAAAVSYAGTVLSGIQNVELLETGGNFGEFEPKVFLTEEGETTVTVSAEKEQNGEIKRFTVTKPGSGFTVAPYALAFASTFTGKIAKVEITLTDDGAVGNVRVTDGGEGYTNPKVIFVNVEGTTPEATATVDDGVISEVVIDEAGTGNPNLQAFIVEADAYAIGKATLLPDIVVGDNILYDIGAQTVLLNVILGENVDQIKGQTIKGVALVESGAQNPVVWDNAPETFKDCRVLYWAEMNEFVHADEQEEHIRIAINF